MSSYLWDLGIDWNAVEEENRSYLPQGFVEGSGLEMGSPVDLQPDDLIVFRIFDITSTSSPRSGQAVPSLTIASRAAVAGQPLGHPFDTDRPAVAGDGSPQTSLTFKGTFPCWESAPVRITAVAEIGRRDKFLLTFTVHASDGTSQRTFTVDPEMVVGENGLLPAVV
ncbi:MAG TPA: hypothetical protein VMW27_16070 [Thermoanaerobaculia bacterium]|nr:hypothetical protein [Thermoanaerobaculia bacterium]